MKSYFRSLWQKNLTILENLETLHITHFLHEYSHPNSQGIIPFSDFIMGNVLMEKLR